MNAKFLVAALIGAVLFFFLGWIVYGMIMMDIMSGFMNTSCTRPMEEMDMSLMILGNLGYGLLYAFVLSSGARFASISGGATGGAIVGFLMSLSYDSMIYAQSTMMNSYTGVIYDVITWTILSAVVGGVIGLWLSRDGGSRGSTKPA
jgi:hypothetical protein